MINFYSSKLIIVSRKFVQYRNLLSDLNDQIKASSFNQHLQVELLSIYGANPSAINDDGKLPEDVAREKGHDHLHIRLLEIKFEVSGNDL